MDRVEGDDEDEVVEGEEEDETGSSYTHER